MYSQLYFYHFAKKQKQFYFIHIRSCIMNNIITQSSLVCFTPQTIFLTLPNFT